MIVARCWPGHERIKKHRPSCKTAARLIDLPERRFPESQRYSSDIGDEFFLLRLRPLATHVFQTLANVRFHTGLFLFIVPAVFVRIHALRCRAGGDRAIRKRWWLPTRESLSKV